MRNGLIVADGDASDFDQAKISYLMTGRDICDGSCRTSGAQWDQTSLLQVEGLGRKGSFNDINFEIYPGEILGITGLLGSGRTELAMSLFGLRRADTGQVYIDGKPVRINNPQDAIRNGIGYVPEDRLTQGLFLPQSIGKNIVASTIHRLLGRFRLVDAAKVDAEVNTWLTKLNIKTPSVELPVQSLSGGNQQRVVLAKWLATQPRILILNGPTVGVDVGSKAEIHGILQKLADQGMGIIIISDDIPELLQTCDRILLMQHIRK